MEEESKALQTRPKDLAGKHKGTTHTNQVTTTTSDYEEGEFPSDDDNDYD